MISDPPARLLFFLNGATAEARILGPVNRQTIPLLRHRLESALRPPCRALSLDLGAAHYLDSDGVRWLKRLQQELEEREIPLRIRVRGGCRADRTLQLLKLDGQFHIERYPAESSADRLLVQG